MDVEINLANVAGVRIRYRLGTAKVSIALSALYQQLLLNPQPGCSILSRLREWGRSRSLTDIWAANTPCWASLGELGWFGLVWVKACAGRPGPWSALAFVPTRLG